MSPRFTIIAYTGWLTPQCETGRFCFAVTHFETKICSAFYQTWI